MRAASDIVVVGGGLCGSMTAYLLADIGTKATVVERSGIGSQASGINSGTLGPLLGKGFPGPMSGMAMTAYDLHAALVSRLGLATQVGFRPLSRIHLAMNESEFPGLQHVFDQYTRREGFSASWLGAEELAKLEPRLNRKFIRAVFTEGDFAVNGYRYANVLAEMAGAAGVNTIHGQVTGFTTSNGKVTAVNCTGGDIQCGAVVIAAGPWTPEITRMLNYDLPIKPIKGEMLRFVCPPSTYDVSYNGMSCYGRERERVWAGCTNEDSGFDQSPTDRARGRILSAAVELFPDIEGSAVDMHTAALRDLTSDGIPVCGGLPGFGNVYVLAGGGAKGLLLSSVMSRSVCDLITGSPLHSTIEPANPQRFGEAQAQVNPE